MFSRVARNQVQDTRRLLPGISCYPGQLGIRFRISGDYSQLYHVIQGSQKSGSGYQETTPRYIMFSRISRNQVQDTRRLLPGISCYSGQLGIRFRIPGDYSQLYHVIQGSQESGSGYQETTPRYIMFSRISRNQVQYTRRLYSQVYHVIQGSQGSGSGYQVTTPRYIMLSRVARNQVQDTRRLLPIYHVLQDIQESGSGYQETTPRYIMFSWVARNQDQDTRRLLPDISCYPGQLGIRFRIPGDYSQVYHVLQEQAIWYTLKLPKKVNGPFQDTFQVYHALQVTWNKFFQF